ncbi:putative aminoacyltransferase, E1 ubiquitin-activating enzyme [Lupinus albus]|uniref:Putative aminoacyltransferase, E1 ubiquitin-activating enzyme n=1 Tax=Lupinus albus TaxID=3870 RepID=A0A6A4QQY0_LUPAL|nr:putative aminoacyltransferase, E1 ubiquitin-activating enzyme [Lupinus albus]
MNSRSGRAPVRSYRRRKTVLDIDLNHLPSAENREQEGTLNQFLPQQVHELQGLSIQLGIEQDHGVLQPHPVQPPTIDVDAFDDDVIESTPRAFAEAKNKNSSRGNRRRTIVDVDLDQTRVTNSNCNKRNRVSPGRQIINCDHYDLFINLEGSSSHKRKNMAPPEPPKEPVFNCPICIGPLVEEVSTKCGHIFCKACIKTAISAQNKCPTCRKKITVRELIRVFLPSAS